MKTTTRKIILPDRYRMVFGATLFFCVMLFSFTLSAPTVFLDIGIYSAIFLSLPLFMIVGLSLVFCVVAGEIDLSFPSTITFTGFIFAWFLEQTNNNFLIAASLALLAGTFVGLLNAFLVVKLGLSSLITTLGMNFAIVGLTQILNQGNIRTFEELNDTKIRTVLVGSTGPIPNQMLWALGIALILGLVFHRHKFGLHVRICGDNPEAGRAMGVNIEATKIICFVIVGVASSIVAIQNVYLNSTYFSTTGDGYLLPVLAAIFIGGTPVTGGKGTIGGMVIGATTVAFIQTGVIASGLDGFWTSFGFGIAVVLSLLGHRKFSGRLTR